MTTPIESSDITFRQPSPALVRDQTTGTPILPTQHLPGVDFGSHLGPRDATRPQEEGSYFNQDPQRSENIKRVGKSKTDLDGDNGNNAPLKRVKTAPAEDAKRPSPLARSSTFLNAMKRRQQNNSHYQYQFDPMSSDSSDSSSSEDERPQARQPQKESKIRPGGGDNLADRKVKQQKKQDAKEGRSYSRFRFKNEHFGSKGRVSKRDGRLNISVNETQNNGYLAKALGHTIKHHLDIPARPNRPGKQRRHVADHPSLDADAESIAESLHTTSTRPKLNIVIMVIGSRGDIQPFLKIGKILRHEYGHRVRIATHPTFRDFVEKETDLEFFSVGGDPSELMAFMVKNPGLVPNLQTIRDGEIPRRRNAMGEMFEGMWRACTNTSDQEKDPKNVKMIQNQFPFIADAIIANPPSMAHVHIAERLGIPLHIMFTFPYTPTQAFPHPLANIRPGKSNVDASYVNFISYPMVEMMTWQGLGDIVNKFRVRTLGLEPVSSLWAPGALYRMKVPYTYMWSPSLVSKPSDWGPEIDISGFVFMELANNFDPPQDLVDFLNAGEPPVHIGFGSIVIDDPDRLTKMIVEAVKLAGCRALVNKGWGGLGTTNDNTPDNIFMLGNTPHDWLFPKCKAVVHHGGAGTTAIGLKCAKPTMIVPFFGDQPFWAARVAEAKAGAHEVIPWRQLDSEKFAEGIKQCLTEEAQINVQKLADGIAKEGDGAANACKSFHRSLPLAGRTNMRCSILEERVAKWTLKGSSLRLSALAAEILLQQGKIKPSDLKLFRVYSWNDFDGPGEPVSGTVGAVTDSLYGIGAGVGMVPVRAAKHMKKRAEHERKKAEIRRRKEERQEVKRQKKMTGLSTTNGRPAATRENTNATMGSALSSDPATPLALEMARDVGEGFKRSGAALLTMPNDLHVALAQGFHNAPRLWGDATVRKPIRITGFKTGCTAAGHEFAYGIYDAWTGLVTLPYGGFRDGDTVLAKFAGLGTGVGKGVGGFVLKNVSAIISPPAYLGKGTIVYIKKKNEADGPGSKRFIKRANLTQGQIDLKKLREGDHSENSAEAEQTEKRVAEGWEVYEQIWKSAHERFAPTGKHVSGKLKFGREKKRWADVGALENVDTAKKALDVTKQGGDLDQHFAKRQREAELAEAPRAGAMEQPDEYQENQDMLPNGHKPSRVNALHQARERYGSDSTFVASDEDGENKDEKDAFDGVERHDLVLDKKVAVPAMQHGLSRVTTT